MAIEIPGLDIDKFLKCIQNPYDTQILFDLFGAMVKSGRFEELSYCYNIAAKQDQGLLDLYQRRYAPPFPKAADLVKYEKGSLGRGLAQYLIDNKIELGLQNINTSEGYGAQETFDEYVRMRGLRLHDYLHVLTGAPTTPLGEGQVAAFAAAQYCVPFHAIMMIFMTAHIQFYDSRNLHAGLKAINRAFECGLRAQPYYGVPWEDFLGENLDGLRDRVGIRPVNVD